MSYMATDSESTSVDTFDMTEGASYAYVTKVYQILFQNNITSRIPYSQNLFNDKVYVLQTTNAQCGVIDSAYLEISTADAQSDDRYCGAYLAATADGTTTSASSAGVVYGKMIHTYNRIIPGILQYVI